MAKDTQNSQDDSKEIPLFIRVWTEIYEEKCKSTHSLDSDEEKCESEK